MSVNEQNLLAKPAVSAEIQRAWVASKANDPKARHEEGGYIVKNSDETIGVMRWPAGLESRIVPPSLDAANCYNGKQVLATFHTHPNPPIDEAGSEWEQGPSQSDRRWHANRNLRGFVINGELIYEIDARGNIGVTR